MHKSVIRLAIAVGLLTLSQSPNAAPPAVGDAAPAFELVGSDGHTHRLEDYRGRFVALAWFPKAFTGG